MSALWIKICGLREAEAAQAAVEAGADAIGFVFAPSPRRVDPDGAARIAAALRRTGPASGGPVGDAGAPAAGGGGAGERPLAVVGVFVDAPVAEMVAVARHAGLTHVQLHGDEPEAVVAALQAQGLAVIRAVRLAAGPRRGAGRQGGLPGESPLGEVHPGGAGEAGTAGATTRALETGADLVLVDAAVPGRHGGTGQVADWAVAARLARRRPLILAGGLRPDNVAEAIGVVRPWGVDVSSGVERAPGVKDPLLIARFVAAARAAAAAAGGAAALAPVEPGRRA